MKRKQSLSLNGFMAFCFIMASCVLAGGVKHSYAAEITQITAEEVANNFLTYLDEGYTINKTEALEDSGETVGYIVSLAPQGYILISGDTIRIPIKAYSLTSNFPNLPPAYVKLILKELKIDSSARSALSRRYPTAQPEEINRSYWDFLTQTNIVSRKKLRNYTPDTFLLTTKWNQGYPYNKFNPKVGGELTLTGCTQTAVAQVMRYHAYPSSGSGVFNYTWSGKTLTAVMNRPFNWDAMPNSVDGSVPQYHQDEVAALMRDLGVLDEADFGTGGTSAYFYSYEFKRAFGYAPVSQMHSDDPNFFNTIRSEINNQRPLLLEVPGHMTVADGYASDASGKKIHVNFGWGGSNDDYYYLDQTIVIDQYSSYAPDHKIYYNIKPCQDDECDPYPPLTSGNSPVIGTYQNGSLISAPNDITIDKNGNETIRIENYDPDGDTVTLSATSSCSNLQTNLLGNLLTLTPTASNIFCNLTIKAQSYDGTADKDFKVLVLDEMIYIGNSYNIGGEFADGTEIDQYKAYLGGNTTISGDRGCSNGQCFYTWIKDSNGNTVVEGTDSTISKSFTAGIYTIYTSLKYTYPSGGYTYYNYDPDHSGYTITVTCGSANATVSDLAASLGIELCDDQDKGSLTVTILPANAVTAGAIWQVDGGVWNNSGVTVSNLTVGTHTVSFKDVTGWTKPANQTVTITNGQTATATGTYTQQSGSLTVTISPANAVTAGGQWQVDSTGVWNNSGATVSNLTVGTHTVSFKDVTGWTKPANQTVTITNGQTATATGIYTQQVSYQVLTNQSGQFTINYGEYVKVFGSSGGNTINVQSGGNVECVNFIGANVVNIEDSASGFTVRRSGAMVYLENATTGTSIKIPATKTSQILTFASGVSYTLIINNGKVMLGSNEVTLTARQL